jgi:NAD(P)-dependent dehydrogenase (short-subunit alcohol dehydrogenase family)
MKKKVCITGVAGGIGFATAQLFAQADWGVIGVDRQKPPGLSGEFTRFILADLSDIQKVKQIFHDISKTEGRLDALVNNAAVQLVKPLVKTEPEEWDSLMAVNVRGVYLAIKYAYPLMRSNGGSIVNISSVHAVATSTSLAAYAASKGALAALTRAAALEMAPDNIRVNAILPGAVDTGMLRAGLSRDHAGDGTVEEKIEKLSRKHVLGRVGRPEEIARMIMILADHQQSSFITGQTIIIDGGATARLSTE